MSINIFKGYIQIRFFYIPLFSQLHVNNGWQTLVYTSDWTPCGVLLGCWRRGWCEKSAPNVAWWVWAGHGLEWLPLTQGSHSWPHCHWMGPPSHSASRTPKIMKKKRNIAPDLKQSKNNVVGAAQWGEHGSMCLKNMCSHILSYFFLFLRVLILSLYLEDYLLFIM